LPAAVDFRVVVFFAAAFLAAAFLAVDRFVVDLVVAFLVAAVFDGAFFVGFVAVDLRAVAFFAGDFFAVAFRAVAFLAAVFDGDLGDKPVGADRPARGVATSDRVAAVGLLVASDRRLRAPGPGTRLVSPPLSQRTVIMGSRTFVTVPVRGPLFDARLIRSPISNM
jgi:hypothetical protein